MGRALAMGKSLTHTILRTDLGKFPYKMQVGQQLKSGHIEKRVRLAAEICELIDRKEMDPMKHISSDEAHFYLCGHLNKQNDRVWASHRPLDVLQRPLHPTYTTVWAALSSTGIEDVQFVRGKKVSGQVYIEILERFIGKMRNQGKSETHWFQQDGARAHTTNENLETSRQAFGSKVVSTRFQEIFDGQGVEWLANSPDLSPWTGTDVRHAPR